MKILLKIFIGLLLVLAAALVLGPSLVDLDGFKDEIRARVAEATGRELTLAGDIGLSLFPWIGIEIRGASLAQAEGFGERPFAHLGEAQVRAHLLPLLAGRLEVEEIRGKGLSLNLIRDEAGRSNWEDLIGGRPRARAEPIPPPGPRESPMSVEPQRPAVPLEQPAAESDVPSRSAADQRAHVPVTPIAGRPPMPELVIGGIVLEDIDVSWDDRQAGTGLVLRGLSLSTGLVSQGSPVDLKLSGDVAEAGTGLSARMALSSTLTASADGRTLTLAPFELRLERLAPADGLNAQGVLKGSLQADLVARRYRFEDLELVLNASGGHLADKSVRVDAGADLELDLIAQTLHLNGFTLGSDALRLSGEASGAGLLGSPAFHGRLTLAQLDLRAWLEKHDLPVPRTSDPKTLTRVAIQTGWRMAGNRLDLEGMDLALDRTRVVGTASWLQTMRPGYRFDIALDELDVDAYRPPAAQTGPRRVQQPIPAPGASPIPPPGAPPPAVSGVSDAPAPAPVAEQPPKQNERVPATGRAVDAIGLFPVELMRGLDLEGQLHVTRLKAYGLSLGDVTARIAAKDGRLRIEERIGGFYQGRIEGHVGLSADVDPPELVVVQEADGIQIGPLLEDLTGEDNLTGSGRFEADLRAVGQTPDALKRSLSGRAAIHFSKGLIRGFNVEQIIRRAEARLKGRPVPAQEPEQTDFTDLRASAVVKNGVLDNRDLLATSHYIHAAGKGRVDIANERLDYRLEPRFVDPPKGRGIKEIEDIPVPIRITGSFDQPDWNIDVGSVLRDVAKRKLERKLEGKGGSRLKELEERTGIKGLEKGLRQFFQF